MRVTTTFRAEIFCGLKKGYDGPVYPIEDVNGICSKYCNEVGLCVAVSPTHFIYVGGDEPGARVHLMDYPRFPSGPDQVEKHALALGELLRKNLCQERVTVVLPHKSVLLGDDACPPT